MECYFWCSSGAGVQLYFTLLWRCTKRQLWVERLAHLPRTAPQQNLGRKIRKEKHESQKRRGKKANSITIWLSHSKRQFSFFFILHKCHRTNSWRKLNLSDVKKPGPLHQPGPLTSAANLGTLCLGCERLSFSYRSKGQCWDSLLSPGQQGEYLWVLQCRVMRATREARSACEVNFLTFEESLQRLGSLFLGYLFTACTHFPLYMLWDPVCFLLRFLFFCFLK